MSTGSQVVLVLGAGINGCAIARELLLAGVSAWVVDRADIASGATAGSSRLIHGGLRYLEYGEFDLVKESLAERTRLLRLAPQFVHPLRLWIPASNRFGAAASAVGRFFGWQWWPWQQAKNGRGASLVRAGLTFYDYYARDPLMPKHQVTPVAAAGAPPFDRDRYRWLCAYYDAQVPFPERLALAMLEDARQLASERGLDFRVLTYHEATLHGHAVELVPQRGAPAGASGEVLRPAAIINATGAWVDETLARLHVPWQRLMGGTKGSHVFTFNSRLRDALGSEGVYAEAADGRPIFITPLADTVLIGTTDVPISGPPEDAELTDRERDYLLDSVNAILPDARLTVADVDFHTSAVRPLPFVPAASPAAITRRHAIVRHSDTAVPLYSIVGGKLTTMRALAELTVATVLPTVGQTSAADSRERTIPGGDGYPPDPAAVSAAWSRIGERLQLPAASVAAAWQLCGTRSDAILSATPVRDLLPDTALPEAMARWSLEHEWTYTLADLVERRLMLLYHQRLTRACLTRLAELLVEAGRLPAHEAAAAVTSEIEHLAARYGKRVE
jgi:glycerol-3-phosphate dehydrogenase